MKLLHWGFIGCGEVTEKKSGPAFSDVKGSDVVAVMSRTERRARTFAVTHGIRKWYTDAQELIDDPDVSHHGHESRKACLRGEATGGQLR